MAGSLFRTVAGRPANTFCTSVRHCPRLPGGRKCAHAIQVSGSSMNAVQRFIRSRVLLLTAAILIAAMCLSVVVQSQSQAALNRTVDENSRGLYDILVQAKPDQDQDGDGGALIQPEIANGQGGISFEQLEKIRTMGQTAVAAPISLVS